MNWSKAFAVARDALCLGLGIFGVAHQEITGRVNVDLLVLYSVMLGTPGTIGLVNLLRGKVQVSVTTEPSSPSPEPAPPLPSSSP
jgi:hypothetical protein